MIFALMSIVHIQTDCNKKAARKNVQPLVIIFSYRSSYQTTDCTHRNSSNSAYPVLCGALHRSVQEEANPTAKVQ